MRNKDRRRGEGAKGEERNEKFETRTQKKERSANILQVVVNGTSIKGKMKIP